MRKLFLVLAVIFATTASFSQNTIDAKNAEKRKVSSFHGISSAAGIEVFITQSDKEELAVTASDNDIISRIETVVEGGILKISRKNDWSFWKNFKNWNAKVYVSYKTLNSLHASSGSSISGTLKTDMLDVDVSSGAQIKIDGSVKSLGVESSSGAEFSGYNLITEICTARASSGGTVKVTVNKELSAKASSGGGVRYKGDGVIKNISVSSGGEVKRSK
ncbi:MAG: DUF2807 domain-containing protein [Sphingobacteriia bacterium]|nr:DUF2807 domain-containing protein [Sphingobacteriia bacterium]